MLWCRERGFSTVQESSAIIKVNWNPFLLTVKQLLIPKMGNITYMTSMASRERKKMNSRHLIKMHFERFSHWVQKTNCFCFFPLADGFELVIAPLFPKRR